MAEGTKLVAVEEYLATTYKPACDYLDGVLRPKPMPTWKHSMVRTQIAGLVNARFRAYRAGPEVTIRPPHTGAPARPDTAPGSACRRTTA